MKKRYKLFICLAFSATALYSTSVKAQLLVSWSQLGSGTSGSTPTVKSLLINDTNANLIYVGGDFSGTGTYNANHFGVWNTTSGWDSVGKGTNGEISALCIYGKKLFAGGMFDSAGGIKTNHIANWDSASGWDSLPGGLNGNVYALCKYNNMLIVGGSFTTANGIKVNRVATWNGTAWDSLGSGFDSNTVYALATYNDSLYAGGSFTKSTGKTVNYIAKWNGTNWVSVSGGLNNTVYALDSSVNPFDQAYFYAGGSFTKAGGISANHIAYLYSNKWDSLNGGTNDTVRALGTSNVEIPLIIKHATHSVEYYTTSLLMVGGTFTMTNNMRIPHIAFWDGLKWDSAATVNNTVYAVSSVNNVLNPNLSNSYIGGTFDSATGFPFDVEHVANLQLLIAGINELSDNSSIKVYPNPSNGIFTLSIRNLELGIRNQVEVYNSLGQQVLSQSVASPGSRFQIDLSGLPSGLYLCRLINGSGSVIGSCKLLLQ